MLIGVLYSTYGVINTQMQGDDFLHGILCNSTCNSTDKLDMVLTRLVAWKDVTAWHRAQLPFCPCSNKSDPPAVPMLKKSCAGSFQLNISRLLIL